MTTEDGPQDQPPGNWHSAGPGSQAPGSRQQGPQAPGSQSADVNDTVAIEIPARSPEGPRRGGWLGRNKAWTALGVVAALLVVLIIAGAVAIGTRSTKSGAPAAGGATPTPAPSHASAPATPGPPGTTAGSVGTTYKISGTGTDGSPAVYLITLLRVQDPAAPGNSAGAAGPGEHLAGAEFMIKDVTGNATEDANHDTVAQGSDQTTYMPSSSALAAGTNFNGGQFSVSPGDVVTGWIAFQLPGSVKIASIQWSPNGGLSGTSASWTVNS